MRSTELKILFLTLVFASSIYAQQQESSRPAIKMPETGAYTVVERTDLRRYNDGRYTGLMRQEVRGSIIPTVSNSGALAYKGNFFVLESTLRDMRHSAQAVDAVIPVYFEQDENGEAAFHNDFGFPRLRGFPCFPHESMIPGSKWKAPGIRAEDPLNTGHPVFICFIAEYEYRRTEEFRGKRVHRITARYASRYHGESQEANGIVKAEGSHNVDILIQAEDRLPVFMRDTLDITYFTAGGSKLRFAGFTLTFNTGIAPLDRGEVITSMESLKLKESDIILTPVSEGIRLTISDIRFVPDSADFLPDEKERLDLIAEALKKIPDRTFLVEGHTAATGRPDAEMNLSIERAKRMIDEMARRGIDAERFIYKGWGGAKPAADNNTEAGRSLNRRVEITILE